MGGQRGGHRRAPQDVECGLLRKGSCYRGTHATGGRPPGCAPGVRRAPDPAPPDGRRARWTEHRRARREDLVGAAVEAVRLAGPEFAVDDVARSAGVSKTVIYRYFSDKDELVDAVLERISEAILLPRLLGELAAEHARRPGAAARGHRRVRLA